MISFRKTTLQESYCNDLLILLDIVMPDMNGFDVYRQLKQQEETADTPVIFVTSKDSESDEVHEHLPTPE